MRFRFLSHHAITLAVLGLLAAIAGAGIRFHNTWSMPACTTSRAVVFEARCSLRTTMRGALGPDASANSMVSP